MGLPMFREPEEIAADQAAAKLDQIAATGRSTIRRESTVRPGRSSSSRSLIDRIRESRREAANASSNTSLRSQRDGIRDIHDLDAELDRLRRQRQRARAAARDRESSIRINNDFVRPEPEPRSEIDDELLSRLHADPGTTGFDALRSTFGFGVLLSEATETIPHLPRPARESGLRFEVGATSQSESERSQHRRLASARARLASPPGARRSRWSHRSTSADPEDSELEIPYILASESWRPERIPVDGPIISPSTEALEAAYPPLRRVNHLSPRPQGSPGARLDGPTISPSTEALEATYPPLSHIAPRRQGSPSARLDGLGDRLRSPSPPNDEPVEENWANLLNTMEPGRSSTATSFLSSRSDSRNGSNRSSQATTMTTSFGEIGGDDSCDLDLPSGITEEDVREIRARHGRLRREPVSHPVRPGDFVHEALQRDPVRGNERILELEVFGVILERMQRREDIPDEWWAAVGLSPDVVRGSA